jgi:hypothetical protein
MIRTIKDWEIILRGMEPKAAAHRIFGDLYYYSPRSNASDSIKDEDRQQLGNALEAWLRLGLGRM